MKNTVQFRAYIVSFCLSLTIHVVAQEIKPASSILEEQKNNLREQINDDINTAKKLSDEGEYTKALRLLFDASYQEEKAWLSQDAHYEIYKLSRYFIHEEQSPLMQYLRDTTTSLYERIAMLTELKTLSEGTTPYREETLFRGQYAGPLIQIIMSHALTSKEKLTILNTIDTVMKEEYISIEQKSEIIKEIQELQVVADGHFEAKRYADAFSLLFDTEKKSEGLRLRSNENTLWDQLGYYIRFIAHSEQSSLMELIRHPTIADAEVEAIFNELERLAKQPPSEQHPPLFREKYEGSLMEIITSTKLNLKDKLVILEDVQGEIEIGFDE